MNIREVSCKTALSSSTLPGLDYSLNPYRGCEHNCAYCYAPNVLKIKRELWGNNIHVKTREITVLDQVKLLGNQVGLNDAFITNLYQVILTESRRIQTAS